MFVHFRKIVTQKEPTLSFKNAFSSNSSEQNMGVTKANTLTFSSALNDSNNHDHQQDEVSCSASYLNNQQHPSVEIVYQNNRYHSKENQQEKSGQMDYFKTKSNISIQDKYHRITDVSI